MSHENTVRSFRVLGEYLRGTFQKFSKVVNSTEKKFRYRLNIKGINIAPGSFKRNIKTTSDKNL